MKQQCESRKVLQAQLDSDFNEIITVYVNWVQTKC